MSTLNTLQSNTINNTSSLTSNSITCTADLSSGSIVNSDALSSNIITSTNLLTASNGFTASGTISLPANSLTNANVNGLASILGKLQNLTGSVAVVSTITSNTLTINYANNNGQTIFVSPTANFSLILSNVPTSSVQAIYKLEIYITGKFYCTNITVNGTVINMNAVGGMANIASQVNASGVLLIQTFIIFFTGTSTPSRVITELKSTW